MCATPSKKATIAVRKQIRPFTAWKIVCKNYLYDTYHTSVTHTRIIAGVNYAKHSRRKIRNCHHYNPQSPRGIHFYFIKPHPGYGQFAVPIEVDPKDVIAAESRGEYKREGVATKVKVIALKWKRLGLDVNKLERKTSDRD